MRAKTVTTSGVICHINNKPLGRVTGLRWAITSPHKTTRGLDSLVPCELTPTVLEVSGTISIVRTIGDGGVEGAGMMAPFNFVPSEKYFSMMLVERSSDTVLFSGHYCSVDSQAWSAPTKGTVTGEISFKCLVWNNEIDIQAQ